MSGASPARVERVVTVGAAETEALGARVAGGLVPGDIVLVSGELGSGKTTFVRGAGRALGVREPITSPTFTIGNRYAGTVVVSHLDLYRLASLDGEDPALLADYLGPDRIAFIEWPEIAEPQIGPVRMHVVLEHLGGDRRAVELRGAAQR